jgi:transposase
MSWLCRRNGEIRARPILHEKAKRQTLRTKPGFKVLPERWEVGRTFAWLGRYRRSAKDYECKTQLSEAAV